MLLTLEQNKNHVVHSTTEQTPCCRNKTKALLLTDDYFSQLLRRPIPMGRQPGECMTGIKDEFAQVLNQILGLEQSSNPQLSSPTKEWVLGYSMDL